jgi:hypothetical protein
MTHHPTKNRKRHLLFTCCAALLFPALAVPARADETDTQQWTLITIEKDLSKRWRGYFELQPRFGQNISRAERLIVRGAVGYRINPKLSVWQGYGWTPTLEPEFNNEHRPYQQLLFEDTLGKTRLVSRTRLEERVIEGVDGTGLRLRSMVRLSHPVSADRRWAVVGSDEVFWNLNSPDRGAVSGFDQNRLFLGVSRQVNSELRVETGYLMNHVNVPRTSENRRLDVWLVQFAFHL